MRRVQPPACEAGAAAALQKKAGWDFLVSYTTLAALFCWAKKRRVDVRGVRNASLAALLEPKFPQIPAEVIPTIVEFWAHPGDYCMTFGPATLVRRGLEQIAAHVATMNVASHK